MKTWVAAIAVILLLGGGVLVLAAYGASRWANGTRVLRARLVPESSTTATSTVDFGVLADLPAPVQRYLRRVLVEGSPVVAAVRCSHVGEFNISETGDRWRPFSSDQLVTIRPPGFDWDAQVRMIPGLPVRVHDAYVEGDGVLHAALLGLFPVINLRGKGEIAEGEFMRFLAEAAWYPTVLLPGQDPAVNRPVTPIGFNADDPRLYGTGNITFVGNDYKGGRLQQWNAALETRIFGNYQISATYNGLRGYRLPYARFPFNARQLISDNVLQSIRQDWIARNGSSDPRNDQVPNPFQPAAGDLNPFQAPFNARTVNREWVYMPFPLLGNYAHMAPIGWNNYHGLSLALNRQFANGLFINTHYTWSKALDFVQGEMQLNGGSEAVGNIPGDLDRRNLRNNQRYSDHDIRHRWMITWVYEVPFKGSGWLRTVAGGWKVGGDYLAQSGTPNNIGGGNTNSINGRPDRIEGVPAEVPKELQRWYDGRTTVTLPNGQRITPCAFCFLKYNVGAFRGKTTQAANGNTILDMLWWGTAATNYGDITGPGRNNMNLSVEKGFKVRERFDLLFSAEATNFFNSVQFKPRMNNVSVGGLMPVPDPSRGLQVGMGTSSNFGTINAQSTFDPRQVELRMRIRF